jgi:hypothetical protein
MQNFSIGRRLVGMVAVSFLITVLGFAQSAPAAESLLVGADKTVSVTPNAVGQAVGTNIVSIAPGASGVHIYSIQASIGDADTLANSGQLQLVHTELRAALMDAGGVFANVVVPLQQEIIGATLSPNFRYRLTMAGAGSGSDTLTGLVGPTDVLKTEFAGHTATAVEIVAVFGVVNDDSSAHPVIVGINAELSAF